MYDQPSSISYFKQCITTDYATFSGRARRAEYWNFVLWSTLFSVLVMICVGVVAALLYEQVPGLAVAAIFLFGLIYLALLIPTIAVTVRRLHDLNHSGFMLLLHLIPFGGIVLFVFSVLEGNVGPNQYGPDPKEQIDERDVLHALLD